MNDNDRLNQVLNETPSREEFNRPLHKASQAMPSAPTTLGEMVGQAINQADIRQWSIGGNDSYRPISRAVPTLPPAVYQFGSDPSGLYIQKIKIITDDLLVLPDSVNERLISSMQKFWDSKDRYVKHGLLFKRGIFLWGPPGGGKTCSLQLLMKQLIDAGGIVINSLDPTLTVVGLAAVRRIEPDRHIIVLLEDMDEIVNLHGEHQLLALLDGENQIGNVVFIGTSNYPDRLGARILNRPSRFDERYFVDMPGPAARRVYLKHVARSLDEETLTEWVKDTDRMSVAHLRELAAAVLCLDQNYTDVIDRLRSMRIKPREVNGFSGSDGNVGFASSPGRMLA